ncbi:MAG: ABC transporter substrate-binding protein, partial [Pseudomonadota bacterium]
MAPAPAPPKRIFRMAVAGPIRSLDPVQAELNAELKLVANLVEPLLALDPATGLWVPAAALRFTQSPDGRTITFTLRDDLYFSNGEKITAEDFAYSIRRLLEPRTDSWVAPFLKSIRGAEDFHEGAIMTPEQLGIRARDSKTLVVDLTQRDPWLLEIFA